MFLPPELNKLIDQALTRALDHAEEDQAFCDALAEAEVAGDITREQALTLGAMLGRSRAQQVVRQMLGGPP